MGPYVQAVKPKLYHDRNLQFIFLVTLTSVLAVSSITPAFPRMVKELGISRAEVGLLVTFFTLPGIFLAPFLGISADRLGRKKILVPSLFLFGLAGGACALVSSFGTLLLLRFIQGVGGAALASLTATIIGDLFSGKERAAAMGYNASVLSLGVASYPVIGGALALLGWNYPFVLPLVAIPIGLVILLWLRIPEPRRGNNLGDYLKATWADLQNYKAWALFGAGTMVFIILYGAYLTYLPLVLDEHGASSFIIGLVLSSMSLTTALVSFQLGRLVHWVSEETLVKVSFLIYGLALAVIPLIPSLPLFLLPAVIFGLAQGVCLPSIQTMVASLAPMEHRAAFMSLNSMMLRLGQTVGPLLMGLIYLAGNLRSVF